MQLRRLSEGITHIEDLPLDEFIELLKHFSSMKGQEKLDGANLWVGIDQDGKFFTSREGKRSGAERRYEEADWPRVADFNQFRAAHLALQKRETDLKAVLRRGDIVEVEVLFGKQPNSVVYGANDLSYIGILRGVEGTPDAIADQLSSTLANQQTEIQFDAVDTSDGRELQEVGTQVTFRFITPQEIDGSKLQAVDVKKELTKLDGFLRSQSPIEGATNYQLATISLNSVPKERRDAAKQARADVLAKIQTEFKLPIKQSILDKVVRKLKPGLSGDLADTESTGVEGIVLRNPSTGQQVKVVDKDVFTAINAFNQSARGEVQSALNTVDPESSLESRGGLIGELRIEIADALGNRELAKPATQRKLLAGMKGESPEETIKNLATALNIQDFQATRKRVLALAQGTAKKLDDKLEFFKANRDNYRLKLKNGKELGMSDDTFKKTLLTFAEARRNLIQMFDRVKGAQSIAQLLAVFYGGSAKAVHAEQVQESLLFEKKGELDPSRWAHKDAFELLNIYLATVFMTMVLWRSDDAVAARMLRDRKNYLMKKHHMDMSPLNHWGMPIWRIALPEVRKHVTPAAIKSIAEHVKKIPKQWWQFLHMDFSFNKEVTVNWKDHQRTLARLIDLAGLKSDRLNKVLDGCVRYDKLDRDEKLKVLELLVAYVKRFVPYSQLFTRIKVIAKQLKDSDETMTEGLLKTVTALAEDDAPSGDQTTGFTVATTAQQIANNPVRVSATRRRVEVRQRNPKVKDLVLKFKDPRKEREL